MSQETTPTEVQETQVEGDQTPTEETVDTTNTQETDWKKVAQEETEKRKAAEIKLAEKRYKAKNPPSGEAAPLEGDGEDDDKPLTKAELQAVLAQQSAQTQQVVMASQINDFAKKLSSSDEEAEAIIAIHNNRTFPEGMSVEQQVQEAYFIAHGPAILAKNSELKRTIKSKDTTNPTGNENVHRDPPAKGEPQLAPQDKAEMQRLGYKWDGKHHSKQLANGKTLIRDANGKLSVK